MQLIYSLNLRPQNERDRKAERLADNWMDGKVKVLETIPVPTITKYHLAQIQALCISGGSLPQGWSHKTPTA